MSAQQVTAGLIVTTIVGWIIWDVYVAVRASGQRATESEEIRSFGVNHPAFPYLIGGLMAHFFWNAPSPPAYYVTVLLPAISAPFVVSDLAGWLRPLKIPSVVPFILGLVVWHFLWPQPPLP